MSGRTVPITSAELAAHILILQRTMAGPLSIRIAAAPTPFGLSWPAPEIIAFITAAYCDRTIQPPSMPTSDYRVPWHRRLIQTNALNRFAP